MPESQPLRGALMPRPRSGAPRTAVATRAGSSISRPTRGWTTGAS